MASLARRTMLAWSAMTLLTVICGVEFLALKDLSQSPSPTVLVFGSEQVDDQVKLSTDVGMKALFAVTTMAPGDPISKCIEVHYDAATAGSIVLSATSRQRTLAPHLSMTVATEDQSSDATCSDKVGDTVYSGTLQSFIEDYRSATSGLTVAEMIPGSHSFSLRFTLQLSDTAPQGATTDVELLWTANQAVALPPTPEPFTTSNTPVTVRTPADMANEPPAAEMVERTTAVPTPAEGVASRVPQPDRRRKVTAAPRPENEFLERVAPVLRAAAKASTVPFSLILLAVAFIAVQDRFDRSDPKLAKAPISRRDLDFAERSSWT